MNLRQYVELLPQPLQRLAAKSSASLYVKERYGLIDRQQHAYGIISAARYARNLGLKGFSCFEFGVASGRGLLNMLQISKMVEKEFGLEIKCYGFDTGKGLTKVIDYRDHPEKWKEGDYIMPDAKLLQEKLGNSGRLILGDIRETLPHFMETFSPELPVGFISFDVDLYSSTKASLKVFDFSMDKYLPLIHCYFDDCHGFTSANRFCGELLAIDEFNQEHTDRKIDHDRSVRTKHPNIPYQDYYDKMYITHFFNHPNRISTHMKSKFV